tara:strand:+ start:728 stop:973 length:246 start_codon:yes stop_codon:yes gene_type:complete
MKQKAEKFLNTALGGNMNLATLKPLALIEIMTAFAEIEVAAINYPRCCTEFKTVDLDPEIANSLNEFCNKQGKKEPTKKRF